MHKPIKRFRAWCNRWEWLLLLVGLVILFRIPSLFEPHHYGDEEIYFVMGRAWREGLPLYASAFDHKPPLIYILAGIAQSVFWFRLILLGWMVVHTVLFWKLAEWFWGNTRRFFVFFSTLVFVILTTIPTLEGLTANAELFMMMPVTAAYFLVLSAPKRAPWQRYFAAGLVAGVGLLFKVPVVFDVLALALLAFFFAHKRFSGSLRSLIDTRLWALIGGFVAPLALTFVYYYSRGIGPDYFRAVFLINLGYTSSYATSSFAFNPFASGLFLRGVLLGALTLYLYIFRKKLRPELVTAGLWLTFSSFGALLSIRPYPHYLLQPAVPFALFLPLIFVLDTVIEWFVVAAFVVSGVTAQARVKFWSYPTLSYYRHFLSAAFGKQTREEYLGYFSSARRNYALSEYLSPVLQEGDGLYVWGSDAALYNLMNTLPSGGRYIVSFHVRDFDAFSEVMHTLRRRRPQYVVVLPDSITFSELFVWLDQHYVETAAIDGAVVYRRI